LLKEESHQLKKIEATADEAINRAKRDDFLEKAEHLMRVDQFIQHDFKLDEE
jgi:hypothetical protein